MKNLLFFTLLVASLQLNAQHKMESNKHHNVSEQKGAEAATLFGVVYGNAYLRANRHYQSANRKYFFNFQPDGNLVIYRSADNKTLWSSGTTRRGVTKCEFQNDGNLVLTSSNNRVVWDAFAHQSQQTGTIVESAADNKKRAARNALIMQNDGNLVIYAGRGREVKWASYTNQ